MQHHLEAVYDIRGATCFFDAVFWEIFSSDLVLWVEHPDLPSDPTTGQDVGLLIVEGEGGPCQGDEVLLDILVCVLHQDVPRVDVEDADTVATAGCHPRCRLALLLRVGLKHNLEQVVVKTGGIQMSR